VVPNKSVAYNLKIKICGITNLEDALLCEESGADALGFIFYRESKRFISPKNAAEIIKKLSPFTMKVGVFVNEYPEIVNEIAVNLKLNSVQLHGDELPEAASQINIPVIKSFRINNDFDFSMLDRFKNVSYLLDSFSKGNYGGTGKNFNWEIIPKEILSSVILAGGISSENIEYIHKNIKPAAVDISSSVEKKPGRKDREKVKELFYKINYLRR